MGVRCAHEPMLLGRVEMPMEVEKFVTICLGFGMGHSSAAVFNRSADDSEAEVWCGDPPELA